MPAGAGQVWIVDAGGGGSFPTIQAAVDAAADGDLVVVRAGVYPAFQIQGKGLSVAADTDAFVEVNGTLRVENTAPTQAVYLRSLHTKVPGQEGLVVRQCAGPVWVEKCTLVAEDGPPTFPGTPGALVEDSSSVSFERCLLLGDDAQQSGGQGGPGLRVDDSAVYLYDGELAGADGAFHDDLGGHGGDGIDLRGGLVFAAGTVMRGGRGGGADDDPADPFGGGGGVSCGVPGTGGAGLSLQSGATGPPLARLFACTLLPGKGGFSTSAKGCPDGPDGMPIEVFQGDVQSLPGTPRSLRASSPVRELETATFTLTGPAGEQAFVFFSATQGGVLLAPFQGAALIGSPFTQVANGTVPPGDFLQLTTPIPLLGPTFQGVQLYTQSFWLDAQGGAIVGGNSGVTVLDQTL